MLTRLGPSLIGAGARPGPGIGPAGLGRVNDSITLAGSQGYAKGIYYAWAGLHSAAADPTSVISSTVTVHPATFPLGTRIRGEIGPGVLPTRIRGFPHVAIGNYDDDGIQTPLTSRQVYTITDLLVDQDWTYVGADENGILVECWLSEESAPTGVFTKRGEGGFLVRWGSFSVDWFNALPNIGGGTYTDRNGVAWTAKQGVSGTGEPYYVFTRPGRVEHKGPLDFSGAFAFAIAAGKDIGLRYFNGLALGPEPVLGLYDVTPKALALTAYTGAARVPWTIANLTATAQSDTTVLLAYDPAAGAASHEYRINGAGSWTAVPSDKIVTGLTASTAYTFEVRGVNVTGNGAASNSASATTTAAGVAERLTNGAFAGSSPWGGIDGSIVAYDPTDKIVFTALPAFNGIFENPVSLVLVGGKYYQLLYTTVITTGSVFVRLYNHTTFGNLTTGLERNTSGTFKERLLAVAGADQIDFSALSPATGRLTYISLIGPFNTSTVDGA